MGLRIRGEREPRPLEFSFGQEWAIGVPHQLLKLGHAPALFQIDLLHEPLRAPQPGDGGILFQALNFRLGFLDQLDPLGCGNDFLGPHRPQPPRDCGHLNAGTDQCFSLPLRLLMLPLDDVLELLVELLQFFSQSFAEPGLHQADSCLLLSLLFRQPPNSLRLQPRQFLL